MNRELTRMIQQAKLENLNDIVRLANMLWGPNRETELAEEFIDTLNDPDAVVFLAWADGEAVGFGQGQLRRDYVEGTGSSPVGYLEGIFVKEEYRGQGIARQLVQACEAWARERGCSEFASDCPITNEISYAFHMHMGFAEANRIICFTKRLIE